MIPSKIKIESFAKRCHMGTLGGKGLKKLDDIIISRKFCESLTLPPLFLMSVGQNDTLSYIQFC